MAWSLFFIGREAKITAQITHCPESEYPEITESKDLHLSLNLNGTQRRRCQVFGKALGQNTLEIGQKTISPTILRQKKKHNRSS